MEKRMTLAIFGTILIAIAFLTGCESSGQESVMLLSLQSHNLTNFSISGDVCLNGECIQNWTVGAAGPPGANGASGVNGTGVNITNLTWHPNGTSVYTFSDGHVFVSMNLTGADGAQGIQGTQGPAGPQGDTGPAGASGVNATVNASFIGVWNRSWVQANQFYGWNGSADNTTYIHQYNKIGNTTAEIQAAQFKGVNNTADVSIATAAISAYTNTNASAWYNAFTAWVIGNTTTWYATVGAFNSANFTAQFNTKKAGNTTAEMADALVNSSIVRAENLSAYARDNATFIHQYDKIGNTTAEIQAAQFKGVNNTADVATATAAIGAYTNTNASSWYNAFTQFNSANFTAQFNTKKAGNTTAEMADALVNATIIRDSNTTWRDLVNNASMAHVWQIDNSTYIHNYNTSWRDLIVNTSFMFSWNMSRYAMSNESWNRSNGYLFPANVNTSIGIGTTSPQAKLEIVNLLNTTDYMPLLKLTSSWYITTPATSSYGVAGNDAFTTDAWNAGWKSGGNFSPSSSGVISCCMASTSTADKMYVFLQNTEVTNAAVTANCGNTSYSVTAFTNYTIMFGKETGGWTNSRNNSAAYPYISTNGKWLNGVYDVGGGNDITTGVFYNVFSCSIAGTATNTSYPNRTITTIDNKGNLMIKGNLNISGCLIYNGGTLGNCV